MRSEDKEKLKYIPAILYIVWYSSFCAFGVSALCEDWGLGSTYCGKTTHIFKYCALNVMFSIVDLVSYVLFPGGGEGARARATLVTVLHFGFSVWGVLMWVKLDDICSSVLGGKESWDTTLIFIFHHVATIHNSILVGFMTLHEVYLGPKLRCDFTLMPKAAVQGGKFFDGTLTAASPAAGAQQGYFSDTQTAGNYAGNHDSFAGVQEVPTDPAASLENPGSALESKVDRRPKHIQPDQSNDVQNVYAGITKDLSSAALLPNV